ncbi:MAG: hypothetical protein IPQ13_10620 [Holophagaceae bacterium]|nr:hypothetical protein [Holophagaceae bacterium]
MSLLPLLLLLAFQNQPAQETKPAEPVKAEAGIAKQEPPVPAQPQPLSFFSGTFPFHWNQSQPLDVDVDGLKVTSIAIGKREPKTKLLQGPDYGTRALLHVTNTSRRSRIPGFAIAVFDKEGRLLGAANGGTKVGTVKPGATETFDLAFFQVKDRLPKGDHYVLSVELRN